MTTAMRGWVNKNLGLEAKLSKLSERKKVFRYSGFAEGSFVYREQQFKSGPFEVLVTEPVFDRREFLKYIPGYVKKFHPKSAPLSIRKFLHLLYKPGEREQFTSYVQSFAQKNRSSHLDLVREKMERYFDQASYTPKQKKRLMAESLRVAENSRFVEILHEGKVIGMIQYTDAPFMMLLKGRQDLKVGDIVSSKDHSDSEICAFQKCGDWALTTFHNKYMTQGDTQLNAKQINDKTGADILKAMFKEGVEPTKIKEESLFGFDIERLAKVVKVSEQWVDGKKVPVAIGLGSVQSAGSFFMKDEFKMNDLMHGLYAAVAQYNMIKPTGIPKEFLDLYFDVPVLLYAAASKRSRMYRLLFGMMTKSDANYSLEPKDQQFVNELMGRHPELLYATPMKVALTLASRSGDNPDLDFFSLFQALDGRDDR